MPKLILIGLFLLSGQLSFAQTWDWARAGTGGAGTGYFSTTDPAGNIYIVGNYDALTITFGSETLNYAGQSDAYLVKYDPNGNVLWARNIGGVCDDYASGLSTDADGNVFVTGFFCSASISIGAFTISGYGGTFNVFLAKYDTNGNVLWARTATGTTVCDNFSYSVATDNAGNCFITGTFSSITLTFDSWVLTNPGPSGATANIFIAKFDADGNTLWAKQAGLGTNAWAYAIATDNSGNAFVTGSYRGTTIDFDAITLTNSGNIDSYLVKYSPSGSVLWAKSATCILDDGGRSVSVDPSGNIYITGSFESASIVFDPYTLYNANPPASNFHSNIYVVKYDPSGNVAWAKSAGGINTVGNDLGYAVSAYDNGVYVSGAFACPVMQMGSYTLAPTQTGNYPMFIANYNSAGDIVYATFLEDGGLSRNSINADHFGNLYVTGSFRFGASPFTIGSQTLITAGINTVFLAKLSSAFVVPVNITGFSVMPAGKKIQLKWNTGEEINISEYSVQRSTSPAIGFSTIGRVLPGGSGIRHDYFFEDADVKPGINYYYRLAIIEHGTVTRYSEIKTAMLAMDDASLVSFTNPVTGILELNLDFTDRPLQVKIINTNGQVVLVKQIKTYTGNIISLDLSKESAGVYWIHLQVGNREIVRKFIKL